MTTVARWMVVLMLGLAGCQYLGPLDDDPDAGGDGDEDEDEGPDESERLLGYDVLPEIAIEVPPESADSLRRDPRTYVPADLTFDGRTVRVALRLKGQNSFLPFDDKPSFRIKIDGYDESQTLFSVKDMTLNNMASDPAMMHERLAYLVAREAGLPASRANHALVTVNGMFYGVYTNLEPVKKRMLRRWFADDDGPLFEATDVDFAATYVGGFEHESGPDQRGALEGLAAALAMPDPDAAIAAARAHADVDQILRYWAMTSVLGQFDALPYSDPGDDYFVYVDPADQRVAVMPWGMDETFFAADFDVLQVRSVFARVCKASPACFEAYVEQLWQLVELIEGMDLEGERIRLAEALAPHIEADTRKPYPDEMVRSLQDAQGWFIRERRQRLADMLAAGTGG